MIEASTEALPANYLHVEQISMSESVLPSLLASCTEPRMHHILLDYLHNLLCTETLFPGQEGEK